MMGSQGLWAGYVGGGRVAWRVWRLLKQILRGQQAGPVSSAVGACQSSKRYGGAGVNPLSGAR